jgi:hypothetical protein
MSPDTDPTEALRMSPLLDRVEAQLHSPRRFVIVGRDSKWADPSLAVGPFDTEEAADLERELFERTTSGRYVVLPLHAMRPPPAPPPPQARVRRDGPTIGPAELDALGPLAGEQDTFGT